MTPPPEMSISALGGMSDAGRCLRGLAARGFSPRHVIDVGASHGPWTRTAAAVWPEANFTLFEPLKEHRRALKEFAQSNPRVRWLPCALGAKKCQLPISYNRESLDEASLAYSGPASRVIEVESLDGLVAAGAVRPAELLKLDVQGFESQVLAGAELALAHAEVAIIETYFFRFAPQMMLVHELIAHMVQRAFRVYELFDFLRRPHDGAFGQCDICFVREGHSLVKSTHWQ